MSFTLHTNDKFSNKFKSKCTVQMDNKVDVFKEFVVVGYDDKTGATSMIQNADALIIGQALQLLYLTFNDMYNELDDDTKRELNEALSQGEDIH